MQSDLSLSTVTSPNLPPKLRIVLARMDLLLDCFEIGFVIGRAIQVLVKDGVLIGKTDGSLKMNRFIAESGNRSKFCLRVKVQVSAGGNSGINIAELPALI